MRRALLLVAVAACTKAGEPAPPPPEPAPAPAPAATAPAGAAAPVDTVPPPRPPPADEPREPAGGGAPPGIAKLARRCRLHGDPLAPGCTLGGSLATDASGRVYVVDEATVRRYLPRVDDDGCELVLDDAFGAAGALGLPAIQPRPQVLGKGPVYMQSGGPRWELSAAPDGAVYLYDLLRGVHRIDRGKVVAVCPELQGVGGLAVTRKRATIARGDGEHVELRGACKTRPARLDPRPAFGLHAVGDAVLGEVSGGLVRYGADGHAVATFGAEDAFAPGGLCSVVGAAACGDGDVCVLDTNCGKLVRFGLDGAFRGQLESDDLFGARPRSLSAIAPAGGGGAWILATHKDGATCEGAVYHIAGAAVAP